MGVSEVIPLICERSIIKIVQEKAAGKASRWQRVALEASRQCRRSVVPKVSEPMGWREVLFGVIPVSLGPRIMRTETTGPAVMAIIQYELGDLGGFCD